MIRFDQRTTTDCLRCCVASVMGLEYEDVPDFVAKYDYEWRECLGEWLQTRGWALIESAAPDNLHTRADLRDVTWIAGGPTVRGTDHTMVYHGAVPLHDPHRSRAGLLAVTDILVIMPLDHSRPGAWGRGRNPQRCP